jgi:DNA-binding CsgD family transcriptional regulator
MRAIRDCYESLTPREREVMALRRRGLLNKQVGGELGVSEITVKAHRGQVMRKMKADSLPDLVTMAARLGLRPRRNTDPSRSSCADAGAPARPSLAAWAAALERTRMTRSRLSVMQL